MKAAPLGAVFTSMGHRKAVLLMFLVTLLWSSAGVITRHLEQARSFELTFWRSAFNALALVLVLGWQRGAELPRQLRQASAPVWISGLFWAVMYTAFMVALTLTTVANVLVTMALGPLLTALFSRLFLRQRLGVRSWVAIVIGSIGVAGMFVSQLGSAAGEGGGAGTHLLGLLVAFAVPLATAGNYTLLQGRASSDMPLAVLIGALLSAAAALPLAWPLQAGAHDLALLGLLGVMQLAVPCLLLVRVSRELPAHEVALIGLMEVVFGVLWAWLGAGEEPSTAALVGGALVIGALVVKELAPAGE